MFLISSSSQVDDTTNLPKYFYRDDGLLVHQAIVDYVTESIDIIYGKYVTTSEEACDMKEVLGSLFCNSFGQCEVKTMLKLSLDNNERLTADHEIQDFAKMLVDKKDGAGIEVSHFVFCIYKFMIIPLDCVALFLMVAFSVYDKLLHGRHCS